jgi:tRNA(fMet)-specific endonuclease VapC
MKFMLDANMLILLLDLNEPVVRRVSQCFEGDLCLSAIAYAEVARGTLAGKGPPQHLLDEAVAVMPLMPFDQAAAEIYARLPFRRHRFDRLIAAHALALNVALVTANRRDFADVPGLQVENWTQ